MVESRKFYTEFLGFDIGMDMGWVVTFVSPQYPTAQLTVMQAQPPVGGENLTGAVTGALT
jgi:hypothetical protein